MCCPTLTSWCSDWVKCTVLGLIEKEMQKTVFTYKNAIRQRMLEETQAREPL